MDVETDTWIHSSIQLDNQNILDSEERHCLNMWNREQLRKIIKDDLWITYDMYTQMEMDTPQSIANKPPNINIHFYEVKENKTLEIISNFKYQWREYKHANKNHTITKTIKQR